jgi:hypothetical protein
MRFNPSACDRPQTDKGIDAAPGAGRGSATAAPQYASGKVAVGDEFTIESRTVQESVGRLRHGYGYILTVQQLRARRIVRAGPVFGNSKASVPAMVLVGAPRSFAECEARNAGLIDLGAALTHAHGRWAVPEWAWRLFSLPASFSGRRHLHPSQPQQLIGFARFLRYRGRARNAGDCDETILCAWSLLARHPRYT